MSGVAVTSPAVFTNSANVAATSIALQLESTTWARDSHDLFDYETRHLTSMKFDLSRNGKVFRQGTEVSIVPDGEPYPAGGDYLLSAKYIEARSGSAGRFTVYPADRHVVEQNTQLQPKKLWLIVRDLPSNCFVLNEGDTIKLGRFKLRVKQLVKSGDAIPELKLDEAETPVSTISDEDSKTMQCRICLLDGEGEEDPLICPCRCKGSIKFVHVDCLRHWINGRLNLTTEPPRSSYFLRQLTCELCRTPFPSAINVKGERLPIVKVPSTPPPFIVLESAVSANVNRGVHIGSLGERKDLKLGRGHDSDVRIADVSISRYHATIRFQDGNFILEDHNSKFGTLVALRKPQPIESSEKFAVQVGRTVLKMWVEPKAVKTDNAGIMKDEPTSDMGQVICIS